MFKRALATSAAFASVVLVQTAATAELLPDRDKTKIELFGAYQNAIYTTGGVQPPVNPTVLGYQIAPQFLIFQGIQADGSYGPEVDLYAQDIFHPCNDLSANAGIPQPYFNFVSPVTLSKLTLLDPFPAFGLGCSPDVYDASGGIVAFGGNCSTAGVRSSAFGASANASGENSSSFGSNSSASGTRSSAYGSEATASGSGASAFGSGATASFDGSTAIGEGAITTRANHLVLGRQSTEVTIPNLSGVGSGIVSADSDGTLRRLSVSGRQLENSINTKIPRLEDAARGLGQAVQNVGAVAAALSAVPELTLQKDEPVRCGVGAGGFGSQYAAAAGCAARITNRVHVNGALSLAPSVDYAYGSTSSVAGRVGISFPLGPIHQDVTADRPDSELISQLQEENKAQSNLIRSQGIEIDRLRNDLARVLARLQMDE